MHLPSFHYQSRGILIVLEIGLLAALAGAVVWLSGLIQNVRLQIEQAQFTVDQQLAGTGESAALRAVIDGRSRDIEQLTAAVPDESGIGEVVAAIEREATRRRLTLQIPVVEEIQAEEVAPPEAAVTESGTEVVAEPAPAAPPASGVLREVRLSVVVTGSSPQVLQFFHAVEHLPYIVRVGQWKFLADGAQAVPGIQVSAPLSGPGVAAPDAEPQVLETDGAELTLELFLSVRNPDTL